MACPNLSSLIAAHNGILNERRQRAVAGHLQSCTACQKRVDVYKQLGQFLGSSLLPGSSNDGACYDDVSILDYLEGDLGGKARRQFQGHLAQCDACLGTLVETEKLLFDLRNQGLLPAETNVLVKTRANLLGMAGVIADNLRALWDLILMPRPVFRWAGVAVILMVAGFALFRPLDPDHTPFVTREPESIQSTGIKLQVPANQSSLESSQFEFRWSAPQDMASYTFLLLDSQGAIIWEQKTDKNALTLPKEVQLELATTYFWQVEGFFASGGSRLSEMASFTYNSKPDKPEPESY